MATCTPHESASDRMMSALLSRMIRTSLLLLLTLLGTSSLHSQITSVHQSFDLDVPAPPVPIVVMGRAQLVYELHLTNFAGGTLALQQVDVLDTDDDVAATFQGLDLGLRLHVGGKLWKDSSRALAPGMRAVVYIELTFDRDSVPDVLTHRVTYGEGGPAALAIVRGARVQIRAASPLVLGPPLHGGPWAAVYHPSWERGHRRVVYAVDGQARIPGRHAVDWMKLDSTGRLASGDADSVSNYHGHREDVLAVADAVVASTRDDVPESATVSGNPRPALEDAAGNYIALDLGNGRYVFYEHLAPGSVRVTPGERVTRGQVIAAVGFTGSATAPHLHLHVADAHSPLGAEGMPFVIDRFSLLGGFEDFSTFRKEPWRPIEPSIQRLRVQEMPAPVSVVEFPH